MALRIISEPPDPGVIVDQIRSRIAEALPGCEVEVTPTSPGHFEIRVTSEAFAGKPRVRQQQLVYGAITPLMSGDAPPVHAVDRLETLTP